MNNLEVGVGFKSQADSVTLNDFEWHPTIDNRLHG